MRILEDISLCCGCHACYSICPVQAIEMKRDNEGFQYPSVNEEKCIHCNQCEIVCPILKERNNPVKKVFACYDKDIERRMKSASGGVFALLAEYVIKNKGVVFGAAFNEDFDVEHVSAETLEQLEKIKGSKYVQSCIGEQYKIVKYNLQKERVVLFTGTACQVAGLKSFLKKDYPNLFCVDVVCHGVPSPEVWKRYLCEIKKDREIINIKFRNKENGIINAPLKFCFDDETYMEEEYSKNHFIKGFIQNLYLRQSCYQCMFKGNHTVSDITIGDFWGLEKIKSNFGDDYGISLVMLRTTKGMEFFQKIENEMEKIECEEADAILENPCIVESVKKTMKRESFFELYSKFGVIKTVKRLTHVPIRRRMKNVMKRIKYNVKYQIYLLWRSVQK